MPTIAHGAERGWYLIWPNGFESSMPDKKTAYVCAAAEDLLGALIDVKDNVVSDSPRMWGRVFEAIAKADGPH